jgi:hypothetical protein
MLRVIVAVLIGAGSGLIVGLAAAPTAAACPAGTYQATSGDCVESPDGSTAGATAICGDGTDSHSGTRSGTCSRHGGVAQWCPCGSTAAASSPPAFITGPSTQAVSSDGFVALAISPNTGGIGWGTAGTQDRANQIAATECGSESSDVCVVAAGMQNGCAAIAVGSGLFAGGYGPTTMAAIQGRQRETSRRSNRRPPQPAQMGEPASEPEGVRGELV